MPWCALWEPGRRGGDGTSGGRGRCGPHRKPCPTLTSQQQEQRLEAGSPPHSVCRTVRGTGGPAQGLDSCRGLQREEGGSWPRALVSRRPFCLPSAPGLSQAYAQGPALPAARPQRTPSPPAPLSTGHPRPPGEPLPHPLFPLPLLAPGPVLTLTAGALQADWAGRECGGLKGQEGAGQAGVIKETREGLRLHLSGLEQRCFEQHIQGGRKGTPAVLNRSLAWAKVLGAAGGSPARRGQ